jgi:hypothetical protein
MNQHVSFHRLSLFYCLCFLGRRILLLLHYSAKIHKNVLFIPITILLVINILALTLLVDRLSYSDKKMGKGLRLNYSARKYNVMIQAGELR